MHNDTMAEATPPPVNACRREAKKSSWFARGKPVEAFLIGVMEDGHNDDPGHQNHEKRHFRGHGGASTLATP
jgi:hypothetical protein